MEESQSAFSRILAAGSGRRRILLASILAAGVWAFFQLGLDLESLIPSQGGREVAGKFLARALSPALDYQSDSQPEGTLPLPFKALQAAAATVVLALASISLALLGGLLLGFLASSAWWAGDPAGGSSRLQALMRRGLAPSLYGITRTAIALMRSVHELLWAVLFLAAFGLSHLSAVIAIAIPYAGTLAKIFSEMIDEAPRDASEALRGAGASPLQVYFFGLLPRALPDMAAYSFYRFECALRSSAVLGFFGFPTLGYYIAASFENLYYGEVWTYLYTLFLLIVAVDWWSGALRRRITA